MLQIKLLLSVGALSALICALLLLWNESEVTCGMTTCKLFETMFIVVSLVLTREVSKITIMKNK